VVVAVLEVFVAFLPTAETWSAVVGVAATTGNTIAVPSGSPAPVLGTMTVGGASSAGADMTVALLTVVPAVGVCCAAAVCAVRALAKTSKISGRIIG